MSEEATDSPRTLARRTLVLDAAARQLNSRGISPASLAEVAAALGLTRAALYGYVEDREDLVFQCYRRSCELMAERLEAAVAEGGDTFDKLESFISRVLDPDQPEAAALAEMAFLKPDHRAEIEARVEGLAARLGALLQAGRAAGLVGPGDDRVVSRTLLSLVHWLKLAPRWLSEEADLPRDRLLRAARRLLFEGLAAQPVRAPDAPVDVDRLTPARGDVFDRASMLAARRETILATASRLFNTRGVESTSIDDIAGQLAAAKRTIYNHFPDKAALISGCQLRAYDLFLKIGEQAAAWPGSRAESIAAGVHASVLASYRPDLSPLRVASGLPQLQPADRDAGMAASVRLQALYQAAFDKGVAEGSMRTVDMRPTLMAMAGASSWVANADPRRDGLAPEHVAREIAALLLNGLRASR